MYTDTFQTAIMMIGAVVVTGYGWFENKYYENSIIISKSNALQVIIRAVKNAWTGQIAFTFIFL